MSCPACNGTMQCLGDIGAEKVFWCDRCGTIRKIMLRESVPEPFVYDEVPRLVTRVRDLALVLQARDERTFAYAKRRGVFEACMTQEQRDAL